MNNTVQVFPVKAPRLMPAILISVSVAVLLLGSFLVLQKVAPQMALFHIFFYLAVLGILGLAIFSTRKTRFEISEEGLRIRGDLWGRLLRWNEVDPMQAQLVNLNTHPELKPQWRTCGTCLPGYSSGWFRLHNKSKALVFITDTAEVVFIPTRKNYSLLLSSENNQELLRAIQQRGKMKGGNL